MSNENLGNSQEKAARRPEINRVKELIKTANDKVLHEDPDFPIMDPGYRNIVRSFGLQGIETVDDLFNRTEAPNYDPGKAKEVLKVMATAVYETMIEEGKEELVVAGSFSVEKYLPHEFVGSDKNKPEESRFATMVVQNYIDKFGSEEKRNEISSILEYLDYINNSDYNQGNLLVEQAEEAYVNLKKIKPNIMDKNEMDAYVKAVKYVSELKKEKKSKTNEDREGGLEIPLDKEGQLEIVRKLLEKVENSQRTTRDIYQGQFSARLEEIIAMEGIKSEVAIEVRSRLKLHDCSVLMKKSNGYIETPRSGGDPECPTVGMAATLAEGLNHALDNESLNFFLKSGANGFPVAEAWDYYQDVNIKYREILKKIEKRSGELTGDMKIVIDNDADLGSIDANYFTDGNTNRKKRVDEYVLNELMKKNNKLDRATAEKAWNMAKKLALATGENSIFNPALTGNDEMAEDIYLKIYRKERDEKGRPRGPQIHVDKIVGIGNSFLRRVSKVDPADNNGIIPLYSKNVIIEPKNKLGIEEGAYVYHFSVFWSAKIHPLRGLLLKRDPDPREIIGIDSLQTAQDYFAKADPDGKKNLKYWWVMGVLDLASSYGSLGWSQDDISKFRQFLIKTNLSQKAGPFLSISEWDRAMKEGGFVKKMLKLDLKRVGQSIFDSNSGGRRK